MMAYKSKAGFKEILKATDAIILEANNKNQSDFVKKFVDATVRFAYENFPFLTLDNSYNVEVHMKKEDTLLGGSFTNEKGYLRKLNDNKDVVNYTLGVPGKENGNLTIYLGDEKNDVIDLKNKNQRTKFGFDLFLTALHEILHAKINELNKGKEAPYPIGYDESYLINEAMVYFISYLIAKKLTSNQDLLKCSGPAHKLPDFSRIIKYEDFKKELAFSYRKVSVLSSQSDHEDLMFGEELADIIKTEKLVYNIYDRFNGGLDDFLNTVSGIMSLDQLFDTSDRYMKS